VSDTEWVWISLSHATFGLGICNGVVVEAPPLAFWTLGLSESEVADYFRRRGATFARLDPPPLQPPKRSTE
jgi:hypothetical protein